MKIVITGATGQIGTQLTHLIDFEKNEVVLVGRDKSRLSEAAQKGAIVREGNMLDQAFLSGVLEGADVFFFLPPPNFKSEDMIAEYRQLATVSRDAAREAGVKRILHLSTLGGHLDRAETGLIRGQHYAEEIIKDGADDVLHLRCPFFLENYFMSVPTIKEQGMIYLPVSGDARYAFGSVADIAKAVSELIQTPAWKGRSIIELQGPQDYTFAEVAAGFSEGLGREVQHITVPAEAAIGAMTELGMSDAYADGLVRLLTSIGSGILKPEFSRGLPKVRETGVTPTEFARQVLKPAVDAS